MEPTRRQMLAAIAALSVGAAPRIARTQTSAPSTGPHSLPPLPYPPSANEPSIDTETMTIHHDRHHAAYVAALNAALKDQGTLAALPVQDLLARLPETPEAIRTALRNNAGGHANHTMFWQVMGGKGGAPTGALLAAVDRDLGGMEAMRAAFGRLGLAQFGLGVRDRGPGRQAGADGTSEPGHAADGGRAGADGQRRVGARLLPEIPEPPGRLPCGLVECGELGCSGGAV